MIQADWTFGVEIPYAVFCIYLKNTILEEPIMHALKFCRQDSSPVVFHFFSVLFCLCIAGTRKNGLDNGMIVLTTKQNPDKIHVFLSRYLTKSYKNYLSVKRALLNYLYVFFLQFFLTEKLNLIKRLKFGRFSFFWLGILCCLQTVRFSLLAESLFPST